MEKVHSRVRFTLFICLASALPIAAQPVASHLDWRDYGGNADSAQYSGLRQINRSNVAKLKVVWTYPTGDSSKYFFNPIVIDGVMYVLAKGNSIVALDAATGKELWTHAPAPDTHIITNRGINYWESQDRSDRRLLYCSNHFLRAIDARTGKAILSFGDEGSVNLKEGLGRDPKSVALVAIGDAGPGVRESDHPRLGNESRLRLGPRRYSRFRCAERQSGLGVPHHPTPRRIRI